MKIKNLIIEAEEDLARKLKQYNLSEDEYHDFETEYRAYLAENYRLPSDSELRSMCRLSRNRRANLLLD